MKQWILILGLIFAAGSADAQLVEVPSGTTTWTGHLRAGTPLEVVGGLGDVEVTRSNGSAFTVQIERKSTTGTPARIFVDEQRGLVCADWMSNSGATKCGSAGLLTGRIKEDAEVGLRIGVPSGTAVRVQVDHGAIRVAPLKASVSVKTYYGDLSVTADGEEAHLDTLRGNTELHITPEANLEQTIKASVDGDLVLVIPETRRVGYHLYLEDGELASDYELKGISPERKKHETVNERNYRRLTRGQYRGTLEGSGEWVHLDLFNHGSGHRMEIRKE